MKKLMIPLTTLALLLSGLSFQTAAQEEDDAKNLYLAHARNPQRGKPGVKLSIELKRGDERPRFVPLTQVFRAGDKVKFHFAVNFAAYVRVLNEGTTGALQLLFPYQGANELVSRTADYALPQGDLWFEFDDTPGIERLTFIFSAKALASENTTLSMLALDNGKDFKLVQDRQNANGSAYGVAPAQSVRQPLGIRINLRHE